MGLDTERIIDIVLVSVSGGLFVLYHIYFWIAALRKPTTATLRINMELRRQWVHKVHLGTGLEILGVQTIRNLVMGSTFMATTSVGVSTVLISVAFSQDCGASIRCIKLIVLATLFMISFLFFAWSVRAMVHASIIIGIRPADLNQPVTLSRSAAVLPHLPVSSDAQSEKGKEKVTDDEGGEEQQDDAAGEEGEEERSETKRERKRRRRREKREAKRLLLHARISSLAERFLDHYTVYFHLGIRCFYLAVPLTAWFLSPWVMFGATIVIIFIMYLHDHETSLPSPFYFVRIFY